VPGREAAKPSLIRAINLRATFELVRNLAPVAAPRIVRETGLSRPTVADVLAQLLGLGLIRTAGHSTGRPGPSAQLYGVNPRAGWVLSLDVGREWIRAGLTDLTGTTVGHSAWPTRLPMASALVSQLRQVAERLTAEAGIDLSQVDQVVVGTPGVVRQAEDHFWLAPNLPGWESTTVMAELRQALVAPVVFENDANLAALGEHIQGVARGAHDFVVVAIGTGVGMGVVLDGELRHGASGLAGEIAYLTLDMDAPGTRQVAWGAGAFEALTSSAAILELARASGMSEASSAAQIFAAARSGSEAAGEVVTAVARRLAHAIAAIAAVLDPELVVLGGGIGSGGGDLLLPRIAQALPTISPFAPRLAVSTLGSEAIIVGASTLGLRLALDRIFERAASAGALPEVAHFPAVSAASATPGIGDASAPWRTGPGFARGRGSVNDGS
jgi:predicted NBD/HSP70 family sugar kinase